MTTWEFEKGDGVFNDAGDSFKILRRVEDVDQRRDPEYYILEAKGGNFSQGAKMVMEKSQVEEKYVHSRDYDRGGRKPDKFTDSVQPHSLDADDVQEHLDE